MKVLRLSPPPGTASPEAHADWLELRCLLDGDGSSSIQDLIREIRRSGTLGSDRGSDESERIAESAFSEIENRRIACGDQNYPFTVSEHSIELQKGHIQTPYMFQLLMTLAGPVRPKGTPAPAKAFEELSATAARCYLGVDEHANAFAFGFPRGHTAKNFTSAIDDLCRKLGEGGGVIQLPEGPERTAKFKKLADQKDGKLDIVAWRSFPDRRTGKLVAFGQCATGRTDWSTKFSDLQPATFGKLWLRNQLSVDPIRMFFVPLRIESSDWNDTATQAGILFDRCRISFYGSSAGDELLELCAKWSTSIAKRLKM